VTRRNVGRTFISLGVLLMLVGVGLKRDFGLNLIRRRASPTPYMVRDTSLRRDYLYFFPARSDTGEKPRAIVVFLGNDVGFWDPHRELAERLADANYDVVGLDVRGYLATLPESHPAREEMFAAQAPTLVARARTELKADSLPIILGGHSFGAELAFWVAANTPPPRLAGVLAMSPRGSGHFVVTAADLANEEPAGVGAFSTIDAVRHIAPGVRVAIVRGSKDQFARHDADFRAAGAGRLSVYGVPLAAHSLKKLLLAGPIIERAVGWLLLAPAVVNPSR
jgi:pimeloyl-ACP methyl ester carboxylesterase